MAYSLHTHTSSSGEAGLRLKAAVDWLELEIRTTQRTQAKHLHALVKGAFSFVTGCNEDTGKPFERGFENTASTIFRCRVQDPKSFQAISSLFVYVGCKLIIQGSPRLTSIEVSLDAYTDGASVHDLAEIVTDRCRFSTSPPGDNWYFYRKAGEGRPYLTALENRASIVRHFEDGWNLTDRNDQSANIRYHAYVKTHDGKGDDGKPQQLHASQHRARFEITLKGKACPCSTLEELERLDFTKLAEHFKFRRLSDDLHPAARYALAHWSPTQLGMRGKYRRRHASIVGKQSGTSTFRGSTVADETLNALAYEKLRELSARWQVKPRKTSAPSMVADADFPGISPTASDEEPNHSAGYGSSTAPALIIVSTTPSPTATHITADDEPAKPVHSVRAQVKTEGAAKQSDGLASPIHRDKAHGPDTLTSLFPDIFNQSPRLEAELDRIDKLMGEDEDPPPFEVKS